MSKIVLKQYVRLDVPVIHDEVGTPYIRAQYVIDETGKEWIQPVRGPRIGVMVALEDGRWGWSVISPKEDLNEMGALVEPREIKYQKGEKVHTKKLSKPVRLWDADRIWKYGTELATHRAEGHIATPVIIPNVDKSSIEKFQHRMTAYFKK
jgi:hypothetical protein